MCRKRARRRVTAGEAETGTGGDSDRESDRKIEQGNRVVGCEMQKVSKSNFRVRAWKKINNDLDLYTFSLKFRP